LKQLQIGEKMTNQITVGSTSIELQIQKFTPMLENDLRIAQVPNQGTKVYTDTKRHIKKHKVIAQLVTDATNYASAKFWQLWDLVDFCADCVLTVDFPDGTRTFNGAIKNLVADSVAGNISTITVTFEFWEDDYT